MASLLRFCGGVPGGRGGPLVWFESRTPAVLFTLHPLPWLLGLDPWVWRGVGLVVLLTLAALLQLATWKEGR